LRRHFLTLSIAGALLLFGAAASKSADRVAQAVPRPMIGTWGWEAASCARVGDDGQAIVKARSVEFYVSLYELQEIVLQPDGTVQAEAVYREEGEEGTSRAVIRLKLITPDRLMVQTDANGGQVYVRCFATSGP
jgi:hypothetical protein